MKQHLLRKFILFSIIFIIQRSLSQEPLVMDGTWQVNVVELSDQFEYDTSTKNQLNQVAEALAGSKMNLRKNGRARFNTKVPQLYIEDARWSFNEKEGRLLIVDKADASRILMEFLVVKSPESMLFYLSESPFVFDMNLIDNE